MVYEMQMKTLLNAFELSRTFGLPQQSEVEFLVKRGLPVIYLKLESGEIWKLFDVAEVCAWLKEESKKLSPGTQPVERHADSLHTKGR